MKCQDATTTSTMVPGWIVQHDLYHGGQIAMIKPSHQAGIAFATDGEAILQLSLVSCYTIRS
jgi:hypothetical protein